MKFSKDPVVNVVHNQLKNDVRVLVDNKCYSGAVKLIYCGIDVMAWLDLPRLKSGTANDRLQVDSWKRWVRNYIVDPNGIELDKALWESRNGMLHMHSALSNRLRRGKGNIQPVAFANRMWPPVKGNEKLIVVSAEWLAEQFMGGVDKFLVRTFDNRQKRPIAEERLRNMSHYMPADRSEREAAE